jgi:hypothetical protein
LDAGISGERDITARGGRKLQRLILACVDAAAKELLQGTLEKYALGKEMGFESTANAKQMIMSPERTASQSGVLVTPTGTSTIATVDVDFVNNLEGGEVEVLAGEEDDDGLTVSTVDNFLSELKEEVVLQSLLHKRIYEKEE